MGGIGTKYATSTAAQKLPGYLQDAYKNIIGNSQQVASQPYTPYTGGFTPDQQQAFGDIRNLRGSSDARFNSASGALGSAMVPTYQTVGAYMNPWVDQVANKMMPLMYERNQRAQQGVVGDAIAKGAYGGNRVGTAIGEMTRQQNLVDNQTLAELYQQGYSGAMGNAQADKQAALGAASGWTGLGQTQMQTGLAQTGAQLGAGTQQQQFDYQQYLNKLAFPYQQLAWQASLAGGLGPSAGGTTTQQTPQGNIFSQLLGAGLGIAGLFRDGGAVHRRAAADGGVMGSMPYANDNGGMFPSYMSISGTSPYANDNAMFGSYIPKVAAMGGGRGGFPEIQQPEQQADPLAPFAKAGMSNVSAFLKPDLPGFNWDGSVGESSGLFAKGGVVGRRGYAIGGSPALPGSPAYLAALEELRAKMAGAGSGSNLYEGILAKPAHPVAADFYAGIPYLDPAIASPNLTGRSMVADASPTINAATPIDGDRLGLDVPMGLDAYAPTPDDRGLNVPPMGADGAPASLPRFQYADSGVPPVRVADSSGVVPFTRGAAFEAQQDPRYSKNIREALGSFFKGEGFNTAPDVTAAMLAGAGALASSKSPFFGAAIGEGMTAAGNAYNARQKLEAELANQRAANAKSGSEIVEALERAGFTGAQTRLADMTTATMPYEFTPQMAGMLVIDKRRPDGGQLIPYASLKGWAESRGIDPNTLPPAPEGAAAPLPIMTPEGPRFDVKVPPNISASGMSWTPTGQQIIGNQTIATLERANVAATAAEDSTLQLTAMKHAYEQLPSSGLTTPGEWATTRGALAKSLNTAAAMFNIPLPINPNEVASIEELNKLTTQFGFTLARTTGSDVAAGVIQQGVAAVPSIENTPQGFRSITSLIQAGLNRSRDYYDFLQQWADQTGGDLTGAQAAFNKMYPPSAYSDAALYESAARPQTQAEYDALPAGTLFLTDTGEMRIKE